MKVKTIIGIDLGTTNSAVAYVVGGKAEIIPNRVGQPITPSIIGSMNGEVVIGNRAKNYIVANPGNCVQEVKRLMGTMERVMIGNKSYLPEEISALILGQLKEDAQAYLGYEVDEAVITVPANFNDLQRKATQKAGELSGFNVRRIINEPTAAALAYGMEHIENEEMLLIYDFGGGTFDITILEMFDGILDVRISLGDNKLGGKDIDKVLLEYIINDIKKTHHLDLTGQSHAFIRIKSEAEKAKISLSEEQEAIIQLPFIGISDKGEHISHTMVITRASFDKLVQPIIAKTETLITEALEAQNLQATQIDKVLLVGGSSKLPQVRQMLEHKFGGRVKEYVNPDEAVALGAAIQGAILNNQIDEEQGVFLTDASHFTLGTSMIEKDMQGKMHTGIFSPIINKGTKLPCKKTKTYATGFDNQTVMTIDIYEGEDKQVAYNTKIGEFELHDIPAAREGKETVDITLIYNESGILQVEAMVTSSKKKVTKILDTSGLQVPQEVMRTYKTLIETVSMVDKDWRDYPLANMVADTMQMAEEQAATMQGVQYIEVTQLIEALKDSVILDNKEKVKELESTLYDKLLG